MSLFDKEDKRYHQKGWGYEFHITNNPKYCGKLLYMEKNKKMSVHYHVLKDEVMYLHNGCVEIWWTDRKDFDILKKEIETLGKEKVLNLTVLLPGESFHVPQQRVHQILALENSNIYEFSTTDYPEDSYRIIKGD